MRSALEMRALRYLARREYSRTELERKLSGPDRLVAPEILAELLDKLEHDGLLSTKRAAEQIIRASRSRFGSKRIIHALREKGIDAECIQEALPSLKETEQDAAFAVWQKKFGKAPDSKEEWGKQMRFMMNRGFSIDVIRHVLSQAREENE
ncbi:recombination regulator RecX [Nitrosomonas sp. JL21]|uniref:recombination regulator RecX n=1 Tax=Nitrosomonas sp. JL21 TaxID=153949 RepID=UPI00136828FF|nr:recombination regulator RecX [Nitrosomonas sp. JL21]MBL8496651.1 recombination regulator RecX [Nitrosomonas sp.]MCC7091038.1 recombination regulator RecX [Nitrosomonas sp.]MXS76435.1 recombination regulator RecX [Nitrosomonas sp. JL21]